MKLPDDVGTPGPWRGYPYELTRAMVAEAFEAISMAGPLKACGLAAGLSPGIARSKGAVGSPTHEAPPGLLLKRWGLIRFRKGEGWEVVA